MFRRVQVEIYRINKSILFLLFLFFFSGNVYARAVNVAIFLDKQAYGSSTEIDHLKYEKELGAIAFPLADAINQKVEVIVVSSAMIKVMLDIKNTNDNIFKYPGSLERKKWVGNFFKNINKEWLVYKTENNYFGIFIHKDAKSLDLKELGLNPDLKQNHVTSFQELKESFSEPAGERDTIDVDVFNSIFQGQVPKFMYVAGHGYRSKMITELKPSEITEKIVDEIMIAQLTHEQNQKFLASMNKKGCLFAYYYSCYSGGLNLHLMNKVIEKLANDVRSVEEAQRKDITFPIVSGVIADSFPYYAIKISFVDFYKDLNRFFLEKLGPQLLIKSNIVWIERPFRTIVKHVCGEHMQAIPTILLPGMRVPMKTIEVDNKVLVLTYPFLIAHELQSIEIGGKKLAEEEVVKTTEGKDQLTLEEKQKLKKRLRKTLEEQKKFLEKQKKLEEEVESEGEDALRSLPSPKLYDDVITLRVVNNYAGKYKGGWDVTFKCGHKDKKMGEYEIKYKDQKNIILNPKTLYASSFAKKAGKWGAVGIEESWHNVTPQDIRKLKEANPGAIFVLEINRTKPRYTLTLIKWGKRELKKREIKEITKEIPINIGYKIDRIEKQIYPLRGVFIYPMIISVPLTMTIKERNITNIPKIISMIPGKAHHYIQSLQVGGTLLPDLVFKMFSEDPPVAAEKSSFIKEIRGLKIKYENPDLYKKFCPKRNWIGSIERTLDAKNLIIFKPSEHREDEMFIRKGFFQTRCSKDDEYHWISFEFSKKKGEEEISKEYVSREDALVVETEIKKIIVHTRPLESAILDVTGGVESIQRFDYLIEKAITDKIAQEERELYIFLKENAHKQDFNNWFKDQKKDQKKLIKISELIWRLAGEYIAKGKKNLGRIFGLLKEENLLKMAIRCRYYDETGDLLDEVACDEETIDKKHRIMFLYANLFKFKGQKDCVAIAPGELIVFGNPEQIKSLDLSNKGLKYLPDTIEKFKQLISLDISNNELEHLPNTIGNLGRLSGLYVSNNNLKSLPDSISKVTLVKLDISHNKDLKTLPQFLKDIKYLKEINITGLNLDEEGLKLIKDLEQKGVIVKK